MGEIMVLVSEQHEQLLMVQYFHHGLRFFCRATGSPFGRAVREIGRQYAPVLIMRVNQDERSVDSLLSKFLPLIQQMSNP